MRATVDRPKLRGTGLAVAMLAAAGPLATLLFPDVASAHALVGRKDLPVPAWLFAWGASLVLIISFALLSVAWTTARLQEEDWRPMPRWFSRAVLNPVTQVVCGLIGVGLLFLVLYAGFRGIEDPTHNFSIIFVFYTFWLGMVLLSVLLGDVFRAFNPWRAHRTAWSPAASASLRASRRRRRSAIPSGWAAGRRCSASCCSSGSS